MCYHGHNHNKHGGNVRGVNNSEKSHTLFRKKDPKNPLKSQKIPKNPEKSRYFPKKIPRNPKKSQIPYALRRSNLPLGNAFNGEWLLLLFVFFLFCPCVISSLWHPWRSSVSIPTDDCPSNCFRFNDLARLVFTG